MAEVTGAAPHALACEEIIAALSVDRTHGLTASEIQERRARHGVNRLTAQKPQSLSSLIAHQFRSIIIWLLAAAAFYRLPSETWPKGSQSLSLSCSTAQ
jgi:Ca2+-transporting ATPase